METPSRIQTLDRSFKRLRCLLIFIQTIFPLFDLLFIRRTARRRCLPGQKNSYWKKECERNSVAICYKMHDTDNLLLSQSNAMQTKRKTKRFSHLPASHKNIGIYAKWWMHVRRKFSPAFQRFSAANEALLSLFSFVCLIPIRDGTLYFVVLFRRRTERLSIIFVVFSQINIKVSLAFHVDHLYYYSYFYKTVAQWTTTIRVYSSILKESIELGRIFMKFNWFNRHLESIGFHVSQCCHWQEFGWSGVTSAYSIMWMWTQFGHHLELIMKKKIYSWLAISTDGNWRICGWNLLNKWPV